MIYSSDCYDNLPEDWQEKKIKIRQYALLPVFLSQNYIMVMFYQCLVVFNELLWTSVCVTFVQNDPEVLSNRILTRYIKRTRRSRKQCSILSIPFWDLFWERDVTGQSHANFHKFLILLGYVVKIYIFFIWKFLFFFIVVKVNTKKGHISIQEYHIHKYTNTTKCPSSLVQFYKASSYIRNRRGFLGIDR